VSRQKALIRSVQIRILEDTYQQLIQKGNLADTFDTVIRRLLENDKEGDEAN
jgi:predicted CopG family antitoxin